MTSRNSIANGSRNSKYQKNGMPATHIVKNTVFSSSYDQPLVTLTSKTSAMGPRLVKLIDTFGTVTLVRDTNFPTYFYMTVVVNGVRRCSCIHCQEHGTCDHIERVEAYNASVTIAAPIEVQAATSLVIDALREQAVRLTTSDIQEVA